MRAYGCRPGSSIGFHRHESEEEIFYILSGAGEVSEGGPRPRSALGDAVHTGDGAGHAIANTGTEPLDFLAVILVYSETAPNALLPTPPPLRAPGHVVSLARAETFPRRE